MKVFSSDIFLIIVLSIIGGIVYAVKGGQIKSGMDDAQQKMRVSALQEGRLYMIASVKFLSRSLLCRQLITDADFRPTSDRPCF